jgi:RNA polymerase sigma factor (sigma-70 family)
MCFLSELSRHERAKVEQLDDAVGQSANESGLVDLVQRGLSELRPRQAQILQMRYGFGQDEHSLREIGHKLGISKERVRQIQERAEEELARFFRRSEWGDELDPGAYESIGTEVVEQHQ